MQIRHPKHPYNPFEDENLDFPSLEELLNNMPIDSTDPEAGFEGWTSAYNYSEIGNWDIEEDLEEAYEQGQEDEEAYIERGCQWGEPYSPWQRMNEVTAAFYRAGLLGVPMPEIEVVVGWRWGELPHGNRSTNYTDNIREAGVSMVAVYDSDGRELRYFPWTWGSDRKREWSFGLLLKETGSDGEPLMVGNQYINIWKV